MRGPVTACMFIHDSKSSRDVSASAVPCWYCDMLNVRGASGGSGSAVGCALVVDMVVVARASGAFEGPTGAAFDAAVGPPKDPGAKKLPERNCWSSCVEAMMSGSCTRDMWKTSRSSKLKPSGRLVPYGCEVLARSCACDVLGLHRIGRSWLPAGPRVLKNGPWEMAGGQGELTDEGIKPSNILDFAPQAPWPASSVTLAAELQLLCFDPEC